MYQSPVQVLTGFKNGLDRAVFVFESSLMDALDKVACDPATEFKSEVVEPTLARTERTYFRFQTVT